MATRRRPVLIRALALCAVALVLTYFMLTPSEVRRARHLAQVQRSDDDRVVDADVSPPATPDLDDPRLFYAAGVPDMASHAQEPFADDDSQYDPDQDDIHDEDAGHPPEYDPEEVDLRKTNKVLVVASVKGDNTSWIQENLPEWQHAIYVMDDPDATLTVAKNKGREAVAYLTYMIDNYEHLPDYMVFLHALRYQWHNEDPLYDGVPMLKKLRLAHIDDVGYANLRCTWMIGCPGELRDLLSKQHSEDRPAEAGIAANWAELFPEGVEGRGLPATIGAHCGSQFAVSKKKVLERPRSDYERYRDWLWKTELNDYVSGRVLEYSWHMVFGKGPVYCPHAGDCFCMKYGLCNLTCKEDRCEKRYKLPKFATIPKGWPEHGTGENGFPAKDWHLQP